MHMSVHAPNQRANRVPQERSTVKQDQRQRDLQRAQARAAKRSH